MFECSNYKHLLSSFLFKIFSHIMNFLAIRQPAAFLNLNPTFKKAKFISLINSPQENVFSVHILTIRHLWRGVCPLNATFSFHLGDFRRRTTADLFYRCWFPQKNCLLMLLKAALEIQLTKRKSENQIRKPE